MMTITTLFGLEGYGLIVNVVLAVSFWVDLFGFVIFRVVGLSFLF